MTENQTPTPSAELDLDEWLAGGARNTKLVHLYQRNDLRADIEELERQRVPHEAPAEGDAALGGDDNPNAELDQQIEALWVQLGASKKEFRVAGRTVEETETITAAVKADLKTELDAAAEQARKDGRERARRFEVKAAEDINRIVRAEVLQAMNRVIDLEVAVRTIAASTTVKVGDAWVPVSPDQVRTLYKVLGEPQVNLLAAAASATAQEAPEVTVPKS